MDTSCFRCGKILSNSNKEIIYDDIEKSKIIVCPKCYFFKKNIVDNQSEIPIILNDNFKNLEYNLKRIFIVITIAIIISLILLLGILLI